MPSTTSSVPMPPDTTDATGPRNWATLPDSNPLTPSYRVVKAAGVP